MCYESLVNACCSECCEGLCWLAVLQEPQGVLMHKDHEGVHSYRSKRMQ
ncbi:hypothetical protein E2C01_091140 [Portunus trituberculatus]|uniref:Uncharacterized protein n=1 Tax=Portunus trituberculatus TaxID=210409 RepID=A0A5B7JD79_PORTR|nr:hypothetical protein [Portunus trituberculatus]